jgi:hypothetical protein
VRSSVHRLSISPGQFAIWVRGRKRSVGGTRYVMKTPIPKDFVPGNRRRARLYAARMLMCLARHGG